MPPVPILPNPVVPPPSESNFLTDICSIREAEGLTQPSTIYQLLDLSSTWVRAETIFHRMGAALASLNLFNGN